MTKQVKKVEKKPTKKTTKKDFTPISKEKLGEDMKELGFKSY